jgi:predicted O-methyltransferase YrrM
MKFLQQGRQETFDFCYLDAGHSWDTTGFAFFLVARLLKPGGWIIFDDLNWSYARSPKLKDSAAVAAMAEDERTTPQVRRVFELLVKTDPDFTLTFELNGWGYAQKGTLRLRAGL